MILRKLNIFGFKSFANKTELHFGKGITSVIGPNGCGKSNVVDAIRWVFGEQRTSVLRSSNMQDVIFSGAKEHHPLNLAEVTLTIANNRGILPTEYHEVAITRRIFRSGESEYLINKIPSRLKDIHNMFLDTGIGNNSYTTIENAMINRILSDKAEERRTLFEEAAGIGRFKKRIKEGQSKLDRTKQDLLRINDRVSEKDRYVRILNRQVEKAMRYKRYVKDLKSLELGLENRRYITLTDEITNRTKKINELDTNIESFKAKIAETESKIETNELKKVEKESELQIASRNVSDVKETIITYDREISVAKKSISFLSQNVVRFTQEINSITRQITEKSEVRKCIEKNIITRETELEKHTAMVEESKHEFEEFEVRVLAQKEKVDEISTRQLNLAHELGEIQKELSNSRTNLSYCIEQHEQDEDEIKRLNVNSGEYRFALQNCRKQLENANDAFNNHMKTHKILLERIEKEDALYHKLVEKEKQLEGQIASDKSKLQFLEGLNASYEGYDHGVRTLLKKKLPGTIGSVADLIDVDSPSVLNLIETVLGTTIQSVVFNKDSELYDAISFLCKEKVGMARMISMERLNSFKPKSIPYDKSEKVKKLRSYIKTDKKYGVIADYLFNHILLCDTSETALKLQFQVEQGIIVLSYDGTVCYSNGIVIAGSKKDIQSGVLFRKKEIEKLKANIVHLVDQYNAVIHEKDICIINRDEAKIALVEVDEKLNSGRQSQQEQETNIKHYENEIENLKKRIQQIFPNLEKKQTDIAKYKALVKNYEIELEEIELKKNALESRKNADKNKLSEMDTTRVKLLEQLKDKELRQQALVNRMDQDKRSIEHLTKDIQALFNNKKKKIEDKNSAEAEIKILTKDLDDLQVRLTQKVSHREELQQILSNVREEYNAIAVGISEEHKTLKAINSDLEKMLNSKHSIEVEQTRSDEKKRAIREKIYNSYEIDLESPPEDMPVIDKDDAEVMESIQVLKERLRRVGEVNIGAVEEFERENSELTVLVSQRDDLQSAVNDLEIAIKRLNKEARIKFLRTFEIVQKNYREIFTTLFEGGEAFLTLEENADPLTAEIQINARPAGKKIRGVTLLSGGERALVSIALLFALYLVKPSAYCILDELDAPLDDANVDRFISILKKYSEKTQFIVITHNKLTMEAADVLYGVTQIESGISTIASVKIGEDYHLRAA